MLGARITVAAVFFSLAVGANAKSNHPAFEHGISGYSPAQFAQECIKCQNEALGVGRSVGGYCPSACTEVFSKEICDGQGMRCRPGPTSQLQAPAPSSPPVSPKATKWTFGSSAGIASASRETPGSITAITCNRQINHVGLTVTFFEYKGKTLNKIE
jgi:hypothetical protein